MSLLPVLSDHDATVKTEALSFHNGASIRTDDWHLMRYKDGTEELYDMRNDPGETTNLAAEETFRAVRSRLRKRLSARLNHLAERNTQR